MFLSRKYVLFAALVSIGLANAHGDFTSSDSFSPSREEGGDAWNVLSTVSPTFQVSTEESPDGKHKGVVYHGIVAENAKDGDVVELDRKLLARDNAGAPVVSDKDLICGYTLYKSHSELPFKVVLLNRKNGSAEIRVEGESPLNYERHKRFSFEIAAHDCEQGMHLQREKVVIMVKDVNEFPPTFSNSTYMVEVLEGQVYDNLLTLQVDDMDGSDDFSQVCHFNINTEGVPFIINENGVLSNTEPLDYSKRHNYILLVNAEDCGGKASLMSDRIVINVKVLKVCRPGWQGFHDNVEFVPGATHQLIAGEARLEVCDKTCRPKAVSVNVKLSTEHIGKGCDRDTYSIQSQRKLCDASNEVVDLLPSPAFDVKKTNLAMDDGAEGDQIFAFDGKTNANEVPTSRFNHTLRSKFTILTWMKHEEDPTDDSEHGRKEHILCNSDGEKMNRHHYSLFVHNCRLVLLLRQEPGNNVDLNEFRPAEWRFKVPEVCDGLWHHFAVSVDFPMVRLHIDGKRTVEAKHNPDIIDDWPLHPSKKIHSTKLVVGACWMASIKRPAQYFRGYLAGLSILNGETENDRIISCLNNCQEKLDFHAMNEMKTGMSVELNSEMTEITIRGHDIGSVENLVRKIGYVNSRLYPTPGHRALDLLTDVNCSDDAELGVPPVHLQVLVQRAEEPVIAVTAPGAVSAAEAELERGGVRLFSGVRVTAMTRKEAEEVKSTKLSEGAAEQDTRAKEDEEEEAGWAVDLLADARYKLDMCLVRVSPPMDLDVEHLHWPPHMLSDLMLEGDQEPGQIVFSGSESIENYVKLLKEIRYVNQHPENLNQRVFSLTCSELNQRFVSNEMVVKVSVVHAAHEPVNVPAAHAAAKVYQPVKNYQDRSNQVDSGSGGYIKNIAHAGGAGGVGMIVIIVVCVGFLGFMIVLGVIRIRAAHHRTAGHGGAGGPEVGGEAGQEMEWDNSALTITVNPMDQDNVFEEDHELNGIRGDDDDDSSDDDDNSSFHDDLESSEEEAEKVKDRDLEWDDSTLTF